MVIEGVGHEILDLVEFSLTKGLRLGRAISGGGVEPKGATKRVAPSSLAFFRGKNGKAAVTQGHGLQAEIAGQVADLGALKFRFRGKAKGGKIRR
jgi:hypothetical protein